MRLSCKGTGVSPQNQTSMLLFLAALLLAPQIPTRPFPEHTDWIVVPGFVVEELKLAADSWRSRDGWKSDVEELRVEARLVTPGTLEVLVTDYNGLHGDDLVLRLTSSDAGRVIVEASSTWYTDVGGVGSGPNSDLHGDVLIQARAAGSREPLQLSFRLQGIEVGFNDTCVPMRISGEIRVPLDGLDWSPAVRVPLFADGAGKTDSEPLVEVSRAWSDGESRAHGWVDSTGRRQGAWKTWYASGKVQSESVFSDGVREGSWTSYGMDGAPFESGSFRKGLREGRWTESRGSAERATTSAGNYVADRKQGEWIDCWPDGDIQRKEMHEDGQRVGPASAWWRNGNKHYEGSYERGYPVGEWTYWNEDGSLREVVTKELPPWARK